MSEDIEILKRKLADAERLAQEWMEISSRQSEVVSRLVEELTVPDYQRVLISDAIDYISNARMIAGVDA